MAGRGAEAAYRRQRCARGARLMPGPALTPRLLAPRPPSAGAQLLCGAGDSRQELLQEVGTAVAPVSNACRLERLLTPGLLPVPCSPAGTASARSAPSSPPSTSPAPSSASASRRGSRGALGRRQGERRTAFERQSSPSACMCVPAAVLLPTPANCAGLPLRCPQCARFHPVGEFEGSRRSCIAALANHRTRRQRLPHSSGSRSPSARRRPAGVLARQAGSDSDSEAAGAADKSEAGEGSARSEGRSGASCARSTHHMAASASPAALPLQQQQQQQPQHLAATLPSSSSPRSRLLPQQQGPGWVSGVDLAGAGMVWQAAPPHVPPVLPRPAARPELASQSNGGAAMQHAGPAGSHRSMPALASYRSAPQWHVAAAPPAAPAGEELGTTQPPGSLSREQAEGRSALVLPSSPGSAENCSGEWGAPLQAPPALLPAVVLPPSAAGESHFEVSPDDVHCRDGCLPAEKTPFGPSCPVCR